MIQSNFNNNVNAPHGDDDGCKSVRQLAAYLKISTAKILALIRSGKLRAYNASFSPRRPQYRIPPDAIREFLQAIAAVTPRAVKPRKEKRPSGWVDLV